MNIKELKELFRLVEKTDFTEVELSQGDWRLRVERGKAALPTYSTVVQSSQVAAPPPAAVDPAGAATKQSPAEAEDVKAENKKEFIVTSPFVGTFYTAPAPGSDAYVQVGQRVKEGQALCIVEAMKLMNELESDYDGIVDEIFRENGTPVEFGEKLFRIIPG